MEKIGRYQIVGELGRGAMGVVYRAVDPNIGRTVALKTMRLDVIGQERDDMLLRFRNEAHAAGAMNHPNIVTIHDADECDGLFYIAMEHIEGDTLHSLIAANRVLPADRILSIARQVAMGLDYAHGMNVVHRDVKPANIMLTRQDVAKIMDFGISKSVDSMTRSGQLLGTPHYMSPEQVKGLDLDGRSDLFSLGVVLYEMATGERPFAADNVTTVIYKIVNETPTPPCQLRMTLHPGLGVVITRCLEKDPEHRYQTGAQLAADLENLHSLHPVDDGQQGQFTQRIAVDPPARSSHSTGTQAIAASAAGAQAGTGLVGRLQRAVMTERPVGQARKVIWIAAAIFLFAFLAALYKAQHSRKSSAESDPEGVTVEAFGPTPSAARKELRQSRSASSAAGSETGRSPNLGIPRQENKQSREGRAAVYFTSNPEGALVRFDERSSMSWLTPFTLDDIVPGTHSVVFAKDGYSVETRQLEIGPNNSSYHVDLVPQTAAASVSSETKRERE
jgi:serine/threonine-protein kinase